MNKEKILTALCVINNLIREYYTVQPLMPAKFKRI